VRVRTAGNNFTTRLTLFLPGKTKQERKRMNTKIVVATAAALFAAGSIATAQAQAPIKCAGVNACKGQSSCKSQLSSSCKGQNACKGQGWTAVKNTLECSAKNGRIVL
jgi:uncharacterized membrane protein